MMVSRRKRSFIQSHFKGFYRRGATATPTWQFERLLQNKTPELRYGDQRTREVYRVQLNMKWQISEVGVQVCKQTLTVWGNWLILELSEDFQMQIVLLTRIDGIIDSLLQYNNC